MFNYTLTMRIIMDDDYVLLYDGESYGYSIKFSCSRDTLYEIATAMLNVMNSFTVTSKYHDIPHMQKVIDKGKDLLSGITRGSNAAYLYQLQYGGNQCIKIDIKDNRLPNGVIIV